MISKKEAAEVLFKEGIEQQSISKILGVSENTISKYVVTGNWRQKRVAHSIKRNTSEEDTLTALAHQSRVIRLISEQLAKEVNEDMTAQELSACLIPRGDIDALTKLFAAVKGKELDWSNLVKVLREFSVWVKEENLSLAQQMVPSIDKYLNEKRKQMV